MRTVEEMYRDCYSAEAGMLPLLTSSGLSPQQIIVLGQLAPAIIEGRSGSKQNAQDVIERIVQQCHMLGIPDRLITTFQEFGNEWANRIYPQ